mmetsp:Transcript_4187/g.13614  ORF Transcript_4187/g.13614 Transcript_4187/m.13614 type:complete len:326 (+) Transcript_4187:376-1353(+)
MFSPARTPMSELKLRNFSRASSTWVNLAYTLARSVTLSCHSTSEAAQYEIWLARLIMADTLGDRWRNLGFAHARDSNSTGRTARNSFESSSVSCPAISAAEKYKNRSVGDMSSCGALKERGACKALVSFSARRCCATMIFRSCSAIDPMPSVVRRSVRKRLRRRSRSSSKSANCVSSQCLRTTHTRRRTLSRVSASMESGTAYRSISLSHKVWASVNDGYVARKVRMYLLSYATLCVKRTMRPLSVPGRKTTPGSLAGRFPTTGSSGASQMKTLSTPALTFASGFAGRAVSGTCVSTLVEMYKNVCTADQRGRGAFAACTHVAHS